MSMLTGMEVKSYVAEDHCCIVYHMQHNSGLIDKHGLRIDMNSGWWKHFENVYFIYAKVFALVNPCL